MKYNEINDALTALQAATRELEEHYIENDGEVTEFAQETETYIDLIKDLLEDEGIDLLGRWLKSKEDEIATLKAERDAVSREIKSVENTIDFIKFRIYMVLQALGKEKVKGARGYSFTSSTSQKTEVNKEELNLIVEREISPLLRDFYKKHPDITLTAKASVKAFREHGGDFETSMIYTITERPTIRFSKPRASKKDE